MRDDFRERLEEANNARLLAFACCTPAADEYAKGKWRAFMAFEEKTLEESLAPIPDYCDHMPLDQFTRDVECGGFTDDDGYGYYATETRMTDTLVDLRKLDQTHTHVVWFNK